MAQNNHTVTHTCPQCHSKLFRDNGVLRCETHGLFFLYGSHLLVRVPRLNGKVSEKTLPWEGRKMQQREVQA